jgi:hypothetical protein
MTEIAPKSYLAGVYVVLKWYDLKIRVPPLGSEYKFQHKMLVPKIFLPMYSRRHIDSIVIAACQATLDTSHEGELVKAVAHEMPVLFQ